MRRRAATAMLLLALPLLSVSCGRDSGPAEPASVDPSAGVDKRDPIPVPAGFAERLTPEYLEETWDQVMDLNLEYVEIAGDVNLASGGTVTGIANGYPKLPAFVCTLEVPADALIDHPELTDLQFVIELPPYGEATIDQRIGFDVFCRPTPSQPESMELQFDPPLVLTICRFPWAVAPEPGEDEYFYQVVESAGEYGFRNLQPVVRNPLSDRAEYSLHDIFMEADDRPDRSGTAVNETDGNDGD